MVKTGKLILTTMVTMAFLLNQGVAFAALSTEQQKVLHNNIHYFDVDACSSSSSNSQAATDIGGSVYMVGDSITVRAKDDLDTAFKSKNASAYINASTSRSITKPGVDDGFKTSGIDAVEGDKDRLKSTNTVIVALGTNQRDANFEKSVKDIVGKIKSYSSSAKIYWVNVFSQGKGSNKVDSSSINKTLNDLSASEGYTVIDTVGANIELDSDGIHETTGKGTQAFANTVVEGASPSSSPTASASGSQCSCGSSSVSLTGSGNEEKIYNYLVNTAGLTPAQAAGIMGNMQDESGFEPERQQGIYDRKVPAESFPDPGTNIGYGLVQWTPGNKMINTFTPKSQASDLGNQLKFLQDQLEGKGTIPEKAAGDKLKATSTPEDAAYSFENNYEHHSGPPQPHRLINARNIFIKYGSSAGGTGGSSTDPTSCNSNAGGGELVGDFSLPVDKKWYTQNPEWFTKDHHLHSDGSPDIASDIPVPLGTPVYSVSAGKIIAAPNEGGYGEGVTIDAGKGVTFIYGHGSDGGSVPGAKLGDTVKAGQLIMHSASTGISTGPHLHVTIKINGVDHCPQTLWVGLANGNPPSLSSLPTSGCSSGGL